MSTVQYEVTYSTLLYKLLAKPLFSAIIFTLTSIVLVFMFGLSSGTASGVMLPVFIHMITAVFVYAPGVFLRFMLYRRWFDRSVLPVSGTASFTVTAIEVATFLMVLSNGISAVHEAAPAFLAAIAMTIFGTILNAILAIIVIVKVVKERREKKDFIQAQYRVNRPGRASYDDDDFFHAGHYR